MCHYLGGGLHGRQKRVKAQSESSKSVVNSVLISREMPVFPGFLEIIRVVLLNKASLSRTSSAYSDAFIIFLTAKENNFFHKIRGNFSILFTFSERLYTISSHFPFLVYRASKEPVRICQSDIPNGLFLFFNFYGSAMPQHPQTASYTDLHRIHLPRAALRDFPAR